MAEAERRPGKTPLRKQPEIEEMEEVGQLQAKETAVNNTGDGYNTGNNGEVDLTAGEHGANNICGTPNGAADSNDQVDDVTSPEPLTMVQGDSASSPDVSRRERTLKVNHSFSKAKPLMRGTAIDDSVPTPEVKVITTPAPDIDDGPYDYISHVTVPLLGPDGSMGRSVLQKNGSLSSDAGTSNCSLSRESSVEKLAYKDSSGVDLEEFIKKTLVKSKKDKQMLLSLEKDFKIFVDSQDQHYQLAEMCSYDRMICHRVAAYYGMDHNIDKTGKCVIVSKTKFTRIPALSCEEYVRTLDPEEPGSEKKQMRLLKKPVSLEERSRAGDRNQFSSHRTKSLEERQKHYDEKRKIIFGASSEDAHGYPVIETSGPCKRLTSRDWSSTDSSGYMSEEGSRLRRNMMAKSNSYGDSITSGSYESAPVRTKLASPENSQSPISGSGRSSADVNSPSQVQPHVNADGTPYRFNPNEPHSVPPWLGGGAASTIPPHHPPAANQISFNPSPVVQPVQYTQNNDLCNRFSTMEVTSPMEAPMEGQQLMAIPHQPHQQPQPQPQPVGQHHLQQHQQHNQMPIMVSSSIMQPSQQFVTSYPTVAPQGQGYYTGTQVQFVPVDAQGQCLTMPGVGGSVQSGLVSYAQPQMIQPASTLQPTVLDQSTLPPGGVYGQNVYTGTVTDTGNNPNGYCIPYMSGSVVYPSSYATNGVALNTAHYSQFSVPQQSSSPQMACTAFAPMQNAHIRPATPPSLTIGQPVGYPNQQPGIGIGHGVSSPPQFQGGTYYTAQPHAYNSQGQPIGQVMQVAVRPQGGGGGGGQVNAQGQHTTSSLQHSQSFPLLRTVPSSGPAPLTLGPAPNPAPTPPQHMVSMKSLSMGSYRPGGGAATPDKETPTMAPSGTPAFIPGVNMQFPGQYMTQGMPRQPQPGDLRVMGTASIRPQMGPSLIAFQPGQPVRSSNRHSGPRQSRPPKRAHSNAVSNPPPTTATASVARVMSLDTGSALHHTINRQ